MKVYLAVLLLVVANAVCVPLSDEYGETDKAMQNPDLFEGDILGIDPNIDRNAITHWMRLWPGGVIPYTIEPELKDQEEAIEKAMRHIEDKTCITFRPAGKGDGYSLKLFKGKGCFSMVGRITKDQLLSLGVGCYVHSVIVHELMHAIGFYHEHSRSDRDDYINIHWENIQPSFRNQFVKLDPQSNRLFDSFDYDSVMLYGETAFSKDVRGGLKTMTSKKPGFTIPNPYTKPGLSKSDIYRVKQLYRCK